MPVCYLLGHSHIDLAWLWTKKESMQLCKETFNSVLKLMEKYEQLCFCQSTAQFYEWIEKEWPEIFESIKKEVKRGRWEIVGGSWVEMDCNIPSGESLVRQFLYGKRYFREKFGVDVEVCWLPDTFGFPSTLPQILFKSGIKYFLTQKLRWNDTTKFPYNIFWWESPDGSKVLAYQSVGSYSERLIDLNYIEKQISLFKLKQGHEADRLLLLFGEGDHGGGPKEEDLKNIIEWMNRDPGISFKFSRSLDYFKDLENENPNIQIPVVKDELYLQFHRGVYTTQSWIKKQNRLAEILIDIAERISTIARKFNFSYPKHELYCLWKLILTNQFHDILDGTCTKEVYDDLKEEYEKIIKEINKIIMNSFSYICSHFNTKGEGKAIVLFNPLSWTRDAIVELDFSGELKSYEYIVDMDGRTLPIQLTSEPNKKLIFIAKELPPLGIKQLRIVNNREEKINTDLKVSETEDYIYIENKHLAIKIDKNTGFIRSIYYKTLGKEVLRSNDGISLQIFDDYPVNSRRCIESGFDAIFFDAWEIYAYDKDHVNYVILDKPTFVDVIERGPVRSSILVKYKYEQKGRDESTLTLKISLYREVPIVYLDINVDWHGAHKLVKLRIPTSINSDLATYEVPYGYIERKDPTSSDITLEQRAKWEVPGQKWVDVTDVGGKYGVSIINDCKYGFDFLKGTIRVTLLRSPRYPPRWPVSNQDLWLSDEDIADQGNHSIRVGIYPHVGSWRDADTVNKAYEFNYPVIAKIEGSHEGTIKDVYSLLKVKPNSVIITALKEAEDSNKILIRVYETKREITPVEITFNSKILNVWETNLIEDKLSKFKFSNNTLMFNLKPNEIKTFIIDLKII